MVSGCAAEPGAGGSASPSATPKPSASTGPSPTPTRDPLPASDPIALDCTQLITPQAMYDYNPNFSLDTTFAARAGSEAALVDEMGGLTCGWVHQTSGDVIEVGVASLPEAPLTDLKNSFMMNSQPVPTYGDSLKIEGYFEMGDNGGQAQAFAGPYWISANSDAFQEPGDAAAIEEAALRALGH